MNNPYPFSPSAYGDFDSALAGLRAGEFYAPGALWAFLSGSIHYRLKRALSRIASFPYLRADNLEDQLITDFTLGLARLRQTSLTGAAARGHLRFAVKHSVKRFKRIMSDNIVPPPKALKKGYQDIPRTHDTLSLGKRDDWSGFGKQVLPDTPTAHRAEIFEHAEAPAMYHESAGLLGWLDTPAPDDRLLTTEREQHQRRCREIFQSVLPLMLRECTSKLETYIVRCLMAGVEVKALMDNYPGLSFKLIEDTLDRLDLNVAQRRYRQEYLNAAA